MACEVTNLAEAIYTAYNALVARCTEESSLSAGQCLVTSVLSAYENTLRLLKTNPKGGGSWKVGVSDPGEPSTCIDDQWFINCKNWIDSITCVGVTECPSETCYQYNKSGTRVTDGKAVGQMWGKPYSCDYRESGGDHSLVWNEAKQQWDLAYRDLLYVTGSKNISDPRGIYMLGPESATITLCTDDECPTETCYSYTLGTTYVEMNGSATSCYYVGDECILSWNSVKLQWDLTIGGVLCGTGSNTKNNPIGIYALGAQPVTVGLCVSKINCPSETCFGYVHGELTGSMWGTSGDCYYVSDTGYALSWNEENQEWILTVGGVACAGVHKDKTNPRGSYAFGAEEIVVGECTEQEECPSETCFGYIHGEITGNMDKVTSCYYKDSNYELYWSEELGEWILETGGEMSTSANTDKTNPRGLYFISGDSIIVGECTEPEGCPAESCYSFLRGETYGEMNKIDECSYSGDSYSLYWNETEEEWILETDGEISTSVNTDKADPRGTYFIGGDSIVVGNCSKSCPSETCFAYKNGTQYEEMTLSSPCRYQGLALVLEWVDHFWELTVGGTQCTSLNSNKSDPRGTYFLGIDPVSVVSCTSQAECPEETCYGYKNQESQGNIYKSAECHYAGDTYDLIWDETNLKWKLTFGGSECASENRDKSNPKGDYYLGGTVITIQDCFEDKNCPPEDCFSYNMSDGSGEMTKHDECDYRSTTSGYSLIWNTDENRWILRVDGVDCTGGSTTKNNPQSTYFLGAKAIVVALCVDNECPTAVCYQVRHNSDISELGQLEPCMYSNGSDALPKYILSWSAEVGKWLLLVNSGSTTSENRTKADPRGTYFIGADQFIVEDCPPCCPETCFGYVDGDKSGDMNKVDECYYSGDGYVLKWDPQTAKWNLEVDGVLAYSENKNKANPRGTYRVDGRDVIVGDCVPPAECPSETCFMYTHGTLTGDMQKVTECYYKAGTYELLWDSVESKWDLTVGGVSCDSGGSTDKTNPRGSYYLGTERIVVSDCVSTEGDYVIYIGNENYVPDDNFNVSLNGTSIGSLDLSSAGCYGGFWTTASDLVSISGLDNGCWSLLTRYSLSASLLIDTGNQLRMANIKSNGYGNWGIVKVAKIVKTETAGAYAVDVLLLDDVYAGSDGESSDFTFDLTPP